MPTVVATSRKPLPFRNVVQRLRTHRLGCYVLALGKALVGFRGVRRDHLLEAEFYALRGHRDYVVGGKEESGYFIGKTADYSVSRYIYTSDTYELGRVEHAARLAGCVADSVMLDVGANIGTASIGAVLKGLFSHAVAVEPDPTNLRLLRANVSLNGLDDQVDVVACAVGDQAGEVRFWSKPQFLAGGTVSDDGNIVVPMHTLGEIVDERGLDRSDVSLVWVDVEGLEDKVIAGAGSLFETAAWVLEMRSEISDLAPVAKHLVGRRVIVLTVHDLFDCERELTPAEITAMVDGSAGLIAYDVLVLPVGA